MDEDWFYDGGYYEILPNVFMSAQDGAFSNPTIQRVIKTAKVITEAVKRISVYGNTFPVYINPSKEQTSALLAQDSWEAWKGLIAGNDLYLWNGIYAHHGSVSKQFSLNGRDEFIIQPNKNVINNFDEDSFNVFRKCFRIDVGRYNYDNNITVEF